MLGLSANSQALIDAQPQGSPNKTMGALIIRYNEGYRLYQLEYPYHRGRKPVSTLNSLDYVLIRPVPIWPLATGHHFPANDAKTPDITSRSELPKCDRFWSSPSNWYLASLFKNMNHNVRRQKKMDSLKQVISMIITMITVSLFIIINIHRSTYELTLVV